jgi:hypothetical protein
MSVKEKAASPKEKAASATAAPPVRPMDFDGFLAKLGTKDRLNVERHVAACELEPDGIHAKQYRRLATSLMAMAPFAAKTHGQQALQLFVPDGKYRMQVFALQDQRDGVMIVYCEDVLPQALKAGLFTGPQEVAEQNNSYRITKSVDSIKIDQLDGKTANPSPFYKDMLGWNRRALRITVPAAATDSQVKAVEAVCALAAKKWEGKA